jgi:putative hydrolase of the HAD superfamily
VQSAAVRYIVLDLGGVVCRFDPDARLRALERLSGRSGAEIHAAIWGSGLDHQAELGELDAATLRSLLLAALDVNVHADTLRAAWSLALDPDDDMLALIDRLAWPAVLFTNNGPIVDARLDHELVRVRGRFAQVFLSWQLGATKPEPAAYDAVTAQLAVDGSQLFLVDDSLENVSTARSLAWQAEVFTDVATLEQQLDQVGAFKSA